MSISDNHANNQYAYDTLIDSKGNDYKLDKIFDKFKNTNCQALKFKPKIFIIDCQSPISNNVNNNTKNNKDSINNSSNDSNNSGQFSWRSFEQLLNARTSRFECT